MSLKAKLEAIIYATEEPVTLDQLALLLKDAVFAELQAEETAKQDAGEASLDAADNRPSVFDGRQSSADDLSKEQKQASEKRQLHAVKSRLTTIIDEITADYAAVDRGMEIRQVAGGYRMATKPEHHDVVATFAKSLKPPIRLSLQALETLSVIAYKQPVTVPEISEIRGVDSSGVIATLLDRKLITTAGRKQVIGRPILYKTTKEFLLRFGLNDVSDLPSMEEFEKLGEPQAELFPANVSAPSKATETQPEAEVAKAETQEGRG